MAPTYNAETTAQEVVRNLSAEITDKTILVTGVSPGSLGAAFVEHIAPVGPKLLILGGRSAAKLRETVQVLQAAAPDIPVRTLEIDLGSLESVRAAADEVNKGDEPIDVLVNNAGIMAAPYSTTVNGFESQFGTNHLGPFLFTNLILDKVMASKTKRIVNVTSDGYRLSPIRFHDNDFHGGENYNKWRAFGQAKTANMLFALSLAEKLGTKGLVAVSLHPGAISTNLSKHLDWDIERGELNAVDKANGNAEGWKRMQYKNLDQGTATHVFASFEPNLKDYNGRYLANASIPDLDELYSWGISSTDARKLWTLSEKLVGQQFEY